MHWSLIPDLTVELDTPLPSPRAPIFDAHMHSGGRAATAPYVRAAQAYGIVGACHMEFAGVPEDLNAAFPDFTFCACGWPRIDKGLDWERFHEEWIAPFPELVARGMKSIKFKSEPRDGHKPTVWIDDKHVAPLLDLCARHGILVQAHIAQPSIWWPERYDPAVCGPKSLYFEQVEHILADHPDMNYLGVHMGGMPEDLDYLAGQMDRFPRYHIDTSATKWIIREMSAKPEAARDFFIQRADRILFGSDLVVQDGIDQDYYTSRFHVQRTMWETAARQRSMIADPDAPKNGPFLNGLDLPEEALRLICWENAARLLGLSR